MTDLDGVDELPHMSLAAPSSASSPRGVRRREAGEVILAERMAWHRLRLSSAAIRSVSSRSCASWMSVARKRSVSATVASGIAL